MSKILIVEDEPIIRNALRRLLERMCEERFGEDAAFLHAYAVPGMGRVVQAAGRLLRSERDRGVIALLGRRFLEPPYRDLLPAAWLGGAAPEDAVGDAAEAARAFFGGASRARAGVTERT